jgi:hypothetical protein
MNINLETFTYAPQHDAFTDFNFDAYYQMLIRIDKIKIILDIPID